MFSIIDSVWSSFRWFPQNSDRWAGCWDRKPVARTDEADVYDTENEQTGRNATENHNRDSLLYGRHTL